MTTCPNCARPVGAGALACSHCGTKLDCDAAWATTRCLTEHGPASSPQETAADPAGRPRRMFWANAALALSFAGAARLITQAMWISWLRPVLGLVPLYQAQLLLLFVQFLLPAFGIYLLLRIARAERWLRPNGWVHALLCIANALLVVYMAARVLAASVPGGGGSYVVVTFAPFFVFPAYGLYAAALLWIVARSLRPKEQWLGRLPMTLRETVFVAGLLALVIAPATPLFVGQDAPFLVAWEASRVFAARCQEAGERIALAPAQPARGLYVDEDRQYSYDGIRDGVFRSRSSSTLGEPLVNGGLLQFFERPAESRQAGSFKYTRHIAKDRVGMPVNELESEHGVFRRELVNAHEKRVGVEGYEVSVRDLKTSQPIASLTYFVIRKQARLCGPDRGGSFSESDFIGRALGLTH